MVSYCLLCYAAHLLGVVHVLDELKKTVGVTSFVVIPGDELDELVRHGDTGLLVEARGDWVTVEVRGHHGFVGVAKDALHGAFRGSLDNGADLFVGSALVEGACKVDHRDVGGGHTEGHASKLAVEGRDYLAYSLGSTSPGGNDVVAGTTATTPVLGGRTVNNLLGSSYSVHGGHETLVEAELVVDDLGKRGKAVGSARGVGNNGFRGVVLVVVDAHDVHGGVGGRSGADNLLGAALEVKGGLLGGEERTGGLNDVVGTRVTPLDVSRVHFTGEGYLLAVNDEARVVMGDFAVESAVYGVVLEHVFGIVGGDEGVVHRNNVDVGVLLGSTEHEATDAAEAVDSNLGGSHFELRSGFDGERGMRREGLMPC